MEVIKMSKKDKKSKTNNKLDKSNTNFRLWSRICCSCKFIIEVLVISVICNQIQMMNMRHSTNPKKGSTTANVSVKHKNTSFSTVVISMRNSVGVPQLGNS